MHDGGVALHPHPAAVLGQEAVVFGGHLPLHQHCGDKAGRASEGGPQARRGAGKGLASLGEAVWVGNPRGQGWWRPPGTPDPEAGPSGLGAPFLQGCAGRSVE